MDHTISPAKRRPSSGRTRSFSSLSSSSSSSLDDSPPLGPATPLRLISHVPFSWEKLPGIPKNDQESKKLGDHSLLLLPLPPTSKRHGLESNRSKIKIKHRVSVDPFFAALVECSKDQDQEEASDIWSGTGSNNKVSRSLIDRFSLVSLYASCKRTCAVSESLVYLPRSAASLKYDLIDRQGRAHKYKSTRF